MARQDNVLDLIQYCRQRREELRLTQAEVARRGNFPKGTYSAFEAGRGSLPSADTLKGFAKGLGVPYTTLSLIAAGVSPFSATASPFEAIVAELDEGTRERIYRIISLPPSHREAALAAAEGAAQALRRTPMP